MKLFVTLFLIGVSLVFVLTSSTKVKSNLKVVKEPKSIARVWRGWATKENAERVEKVLREEAIPGIEAHKPAGLKGIELWTFQEGNEIQFTTIMYFESIESVKEFAGPNIENAHIDPAIKPLLSRYDAQVKHQLIKESKVWD
jgi:hypothetical protein